MNQLHVTLQHSTLETSQEGAELLYFTMPRVQPCPLQEGDFAKTTIDLPLFHSLVFVHHLIEIKSSFNMRLFHYFIFQNVF
ncbi:unnamed protein product [Arctogadus glacialis]